MSGNQGSFGENVAEWIDDIETRLDAIQRTLEIVVRVQTKFYEMEIGRARSKIKKARIGGTATRKLKSFRRARK